MRRSVLLAAVAAVGLLSPGALQAATFTFSFSNYDGYIGGTVNGRVILPDGDGVSAAQKVFFQSAPAGLGFPYTMPIDLLTLPGPVSANSFEVSGGEIIHANFSHSFGPTGCTWFQMTTDVAVALTSYEACDWADSLLDTRAITLRFTAVPLPAAAPLTLLGLAGLGLVVRRRKAT